MRYEGHLGEGRYEDDGQQSKSGSTLKVELTKAIEGIDVMCDVEKEIKDDTLAQLIG